MPIFPGIFEHKNTVSDFCRDPSLTSNTHEDTDRILAVEYTLNACSQKDLSEETQKRISTTYSYLPGLPALELRRKRRESLQRLLKMITENAITFTAGPLLKKQTEKLAEARQKATDRDERVQIARVVRAATEQVSRNLAQQPGNDGTP